MKFGSDKLHKFGDFTKFSIIFNSKSTKSLAHVFKKGGKFKFLKFGIMCVPTGVCSNTKLQSYIKCNAMFRDVDSKKVLGGLYNHKI